MAKVCLLVATGQRVGGGLTQKCGGKSREGGRREETDEKERCRRPPE